jgi:hypothetical protein
MLSIFLRTGLIWIPHEITKNNIAVGTSDLDEVHDPSIEREITSERSMSPSEGGLFFSEKMNGEVFGFPQERKKARRGKIR